MDKIIDTLFCLLEYSTAKWPRRRMSSSVDGSQAYTYASFHSKVAEVSALLAQHRVYGGKVAILSENCPNWTVAFFASAGMGRVAGSNSSGQFTDGGVEYPGALRIRGSHRFSTSVAKSR